MKCKWKNKRASQLSGDRDNYQFFSVSSALPKWRKKQILREFFGKEKCNIENKLNDAIRTISLLFVVRNRLAWFFLISCVYAALEPRSYISSIIQKCLFHCWYENEFTLIPLILRKRWKKRCILQSFIVLLRVPMMTSFPPFI